jgi:enamine deaminase RidA (YjgF/YER057c/UK114 family)
MFHGSRSALQFLAGLICVQELQALKGDAVEKPKQIVQPSDLPVRESHSQVVAVTGGTLVFIAGMTSRSEKDATPVHPGDMRAQLRQVCENIGRALRSVGGDYSDVVKTTTFTTDVDEYHRCGDERRKYFKEALPTSALIGVKRLAHPDLMVEIECMAVIPSDRFKPGS